MPERMGKPKSVSLSTCLTVVYAYLLCFSGDKLGVQLWEYERYARADCDLPPLVQIQSIECHVGRSVITIGGSKVWATVPLHRVSDARTRCKY